MFRPVLFAGAFSLAIVTAAAQAASSCGPLNTNAGCFCGVADLSTNGETKYYSPSSSDDIGARVGCSNCDVGSFAAIDLQLPGGATVPCGCLPQDGSLHLQSCANTPRNALAEGGPYNLIFQSNRYGAVQFSVTHTQQTFVAAASTVTVTTTPTSISTTVITTTPTDTTTASQTTVTSPVASTATNTITVVRGATRTTTTITTSMTITKTKFVMTATTTTQTAACTSASVVSADNGKSRRSELQPFRARFGRSWIQKRDTPSRPQGLAGDGSLTTTITPSPSVSTSAASATTTMVTSTSIAAATTVTIQPTPATTTIFTGRSVINTTTTLARVTRTQTVTSRMVTTTSVTTTITKTRTTTTTPVCAQPTMPQQNSG